MGLFLVSTTLQRGLADRYILPPSNSQVGLVTALDVLEHAELDFWPRYANLAAFGWLPLSL